MNLFVPSPEIRPSVEALDDKRVVKMVLETAQLLSTAIRILDPETTLPIYKMTHKNHPVSVWVRSSIYGASSPLYRVYKVASYRA